MDQADLFVETECSRSPLAATRFGLPQPQSHREVRTILAALGRKQRKGNVLVPETHQGAWPRRGGACDDQDEGELKTEPLVRKNLFVPDPVVVQQEIEILNKQARFFLLFYAQAVFGLKAVADELTRLVSLR